MSNYNLILSVLALAISLTSLGWNIYNKIKSERKKLLIQCYKLKSKESFQCTVTLTNIGNKPIFIRRIEMEEEVQGNAIKRALDFQKYSDDFKNVPLNPEHWKTFIFEETKHFGFFDLENKKFKKTRIKVIDNKGKNYISNWFRQNNLR